MKTTKFNKILLLSVAMALALVGTVLAVHLLGLFELDRNATYDGNADDWAILYAGGGSAEKFTGIIEDTMGTNPLGSIGTQFQAGGSKDDLDISPGGATGQNWKWDPGEPLDKDDITNAYASAYVDDSGDLIIYFGLDRFANNGSAQVGFWFLQDPAFGLTTTPSGGGYLFSGHHEVGDVLVQSNFSQGGVIDTISVYEWVGAGGSAGTLNLLYNAQDCTTTAAGDLACATVNQGDTPSPWPFTPKFGVSGTFPQGSFFEGGINITQLVPDAGCFSNFLAETRSSTPFDSRLKDFAFGRFELCSIAVVKTGDTLSKIGDDVGYEITVTNDGALKLYKDSIADSLLGDLTGDGGCGASLAPGESCTISVMRTVVEGDPDPLPNTVVVTYNSNSGLTGDSVTNSDDHSVPLFQPAIAFDKSADKILSKVGDTVNYTLTLDNNSSADSPNLTCSITDAMLGISESVNLASGEQEVINKAVVIPADASDPYNNSASVSCQVDGFPNVLEASDSWSVNLFYPAIAVAKAGDALSKVGDTVNYAITLSNNSSADSPALSCSATDSLTAATVFDAVLPLGDTVVNTSHLVTAGDADPLTNTVDLTCSIEGFPNTVAASGSFATNLFQPAIAFDKSADKTLSKVGDTVNYTLTLDNNSSIDSPNLTCSITDAVLGINETGVHLASGAQHVISKAQVIPSGAADPYVNTANVSCQVDGYPNILTASDGWSVNLFYPAIAVAKTGDALSKVGDTVNYTITLSNNSSADTPLLGCVATDTLLGGVFNGILPLGDTVLNLSRTVEMGDPDPLENAVSMNCSVTGFPNVLDAGPATHSTQLFQPAVEIIKTGPDTATRGETITYNFTINNLSSADAPDLVLASVTDTIIGDLTTAATAGGCGTLASSGSCNFTADYTIAFDDPNPLVNVVTALYHPDGFPNDISDDDDHTVTIPILGCTPGFWQGGAGAPLWNVLMDQDWNDAGYATVYNPYAHDTLFNDFFNVVTDPRLDGITMYDLVSSGGGSDSARKAARDMVAAYLNESAFPADFPADSLDALTTMWYDAVAGGDAALDAFHNLVSGWNSPDPPGYCPLP